MFATCESCGRRWSEPIPDRCQGPDCDTKLTAPKGAERAAAADGAADQGADADADGAADQGTDAAADGAADQGADDQGTDADAAAADGADAGTKPKRGKS